MNSGRKICFVIGSTYPFTRGGDELLFTDIFNIIIKNRGWEVVVLTRKPRKKASIAIENHLPYRSLKTLRSRFFGRFFDLRYPVFYDILYFGKQVAKLSDNFLSKYPLVLTPNPIVSYELGKKQVRPLIVQFIGGAWADNLAVNRPRFHSKAKEIEQTAYAQADHIVVMDQIYADEYKLTKNRYTIIPSGINPSVFDPNLFNRNELRKKYSMEGQKVIINVASLRSGIKGQDLLLKAIPDIIRKVPNCHFYFVGKGAQNTLLQLAETLRISNHVHFLGERKDIPQLLAVSDIFVLPSLSEGTPRALLEAMAMGLPCIATKVGGIPEVITDHSNGILIPPGDYAAITESIINILNDSASTNLMKTKARNYVLDRYNLNRTSEMYANLIERLLTENG